jgi:integrase
MTSMRPPQHGHVRDVEAKDKAKPRDLVYSMEQVAALLEAAWARPERHHVVRYVMIALSTCGRGEAILDLHDRQISRGLVHFLDSDRAQTSKRRSIVPVAPTLAPWLEGVEGKIITYRAPIATSRWADPGKPEWFERECWDIGKAFDACLVEAGICEPVVGRDGAPAVLPPRRKLGETEPRPRLRGLGTPNTLRHTAISEMHRRNVDERQIDMAAGHAPIGTGKRNYMHLRPDYLAQLIAAVEAYWSDMERFTKVHRRSQCGPNKVPGGGSGS